MNQEQAKQNLEKCLALVDSQEIIDFTARLVRIQSFPPDYNERNVALAIADKLEEYGISSQFDEYEDNRCNMTASIGSQEGPHLVLSGHMDTVSPGDVEWAYDPFGAQVVDGIMYGRGTADMKGGVAALVMALCYLKISGIELPGRLSFLGSLGEEDGCVGAMRYVEKHGADDIDAIIVGEASNGDMYVAQLGALWLKLTSRGVAAHPGVSWQGVNALDNMIRFLEKFRRYRFEVEEHPLLGHSTLNIDMLHAGESINTLPTICTCSIDIRTIPGVSHEAIIARAQEMIRELEESVPGFDLECEVVTDKASTSMDLQAPICQAAFQAGRQIFGREIEAKGTFFGTDSRVMVKRDGSRPDFIIYGPGDPCWNHKVNEQIQVSQLVEATRFYIAAVLNYMMKEGI